MILSSCVLIPAFIAVFVSGQYPHGVPEPSPSHVLHHTNNKRIEKLNLADQFAGSENQYHLQNQKANGNLLQHGAKKFKGGDAGSRKFSAAGAFGDQHENKKYKDNEQFHSLSGKNGKKAANKSSSSHEGGSISASKDMGTKSGMSDTSSQNKTHKKDYILTDTIHYGFDQKFDQDEEQDGMYKANKHSDSHSLDDLHDKHKDFKRQRGSSAKASSMIGSQRGVKESSEQAHSGARAMKMGDFFEKENNRKRQGAHSDLYGSRLDYNAGGHGFSNEKGESLSKSGNSYDVKNRKSSKEAQKTQHGRRGGEYNQAAKNKNYGLKLSGKHSQHLRAGSALVGQSTKVVAGIGIGTGKSLSSAEQNFNAGSGKGFSTKNNERNRSKGNYKDGESHADHVKNNRSKQDSSEQKAAHDRQYAGASKFYRNNDSANSKSGSLRGSENSKRNLVDRVKNENESKTFHTSKKVKGNNYERLDFDRKKLEKDRAKDAQFKSSDGKKYNSKYRKVDNKGKHYTGAKTAAQQNYNTKDLNKKTHAVSALQKSAADDRRYKAKNNGQSAFDRFGEGFDGFGFKSAKAKEEAARGNQDHGIHGTGLGERHFKNLDFSRNKPSFAARQKHIIMKTTPHPFIRNDNQEFAFGFGQSNFDIPSHNSGNAFSSFHNPFGPASYNTFGNFHVNSGSYRQNDAKRRLPKTRHLETYQRRPASNHRGHANSNTKSKRYNHIRGTIQPQAHTQNGIFGNFESLSMSKLFSESVFGPSESLSTFDGFRK